MWHTAKATYIVHTTKPLNRDNIRYSIVWFLCRYRKFCRQFELNSRSREPHPALQREGGGGGGGWVGTSILPHPALSPIMTLGLPSNRDLLIDYYKCSSAWREHPTKSHTTPTHPPPRPPNPPPTERYCLSTICIEMVKNPLKKVFSRKVWCGHHTWP